MPFDEFVRMFRLIAFKLTDEIDDAAEAARRICHAADLKDWQIGKHKVWCKARCAGAGAGPSASPCCCAHSRLTNPSVDYDRSFCGTTTWTSSRPS